MVNNSEDIDNENNESSEHFGMKVISEVTIDKKFLLPDEATVSKQSWNAIHEIIYYN